MNRKNMKISLWSLLLTLVLVLGLVLVNGEHKAAAAEESSPLKSNLVTVCVSMEKFTLGQGYIIEPILVKVNENARASLVITELLKERYPQVPQPWKMTGSLEEAFYLSAVYDPNRDMPTVPGYILDKASIDFNGETDEWLGEFDYCTTSGWMYAVNGKFPSVGAADWQFHDGDVVRWQFTLYGYGSDLGADNEEWGAENITNVGNKDALTWTVAVCNGIYDRTLLTSNRSYENALAVLEDMEASQEQVDAALAALKGDGPRFRDVTKDAWYKEAVDYVLECDLFKGTSTSAFSPDKPLTRGMVITVLHRLAGEPAASSQTSFSDVHREDWYGPAAAWVKEKNLAAGLLSDENFQPEQMITREQLANLLYNYAKLADPGLTPQGDLSAFADGGDVSPAYRDAVAWALGADILKGTDSGALLPGGDLTRSQFAAMIMRFSRQ